MSSEVLIRSREIGKKFGWLSDKLRALALKAGLAKPDDQRADSWYWLVGPKLHRIERPPGPWTHFRAKLPPENHVVFDVEAGLRRGARGVALVFFMGMGDYVLSTPMIAALRRKHPQVPIHAYVSSNLDVNNSPLVADLIRLNPNIDRVIPFKGGVAPKGLDWRNYDYAEVFEKAPADFLVVPMIYEHAPGVRHRVVTLFETFSLPAPAAPLIPQIYLTEQTSENVIRTMDDIRRRFRELDRIGIVFLQLDHRSSGYRYPFADELAERLCQEGFLVVSVAKHSMRHQACIGIDIATFPIADSIHLVKAMGDAYGDALSLLTVNSVFWSVSSGLKIRNVGMQHFFDSCIHNVWYSNIHVIAHRIYPGIPYDRQILAGAGDFILRNRWFADYKPEFVVRCFRDIVHA